MSLRFFAIYAVLSFLLFLVIFIHQSIKNKKIILPRFKFSLKTYYILLSPAPIAAILESYLSNSFLPFILFCVFCIAGIIGEVTFSFWWNYFYTKKFWEYRVDTWLNTYTSSLNFLAWGLGGFIFMAVLELFPYLNISQIPIIYIIMFFPVAFLQLVIFWFIKPSIKHKFNKVTILNWLFFLLPIIVPLVFFTYHHGYTFLLLFGWFGVFASLIEYLFGKACELFLFKKLWVYNHWAIDKGHFTILSLPAFALGGFYFWFIYILVLLVV